jgi:hypothetical protein
MSRWWPVVLGVVLVGLAGCGRGRPPLVSQTITVVVGAGERGEDAQLLISGVERVTVGGQEVLGVVPGRASGDRWVLKETRMLATPVMAGSKGELTVTGPQGAQTIPIVFSDSVIPRTRTHQMWGRDILVQCYYSVGDKWGLVVRVQE